jgi:hypothetical protein
MTPKTKLISHRAVMQSASAFLLAAGSGLPKEVGTVPRPLRIPDQMPSGAIEKLSHFTGNE